MDKFITPTLTLFGVLIGLVVRKSTDDKRDYIDNITKERKEWRDNIRNLTKELNSDQANYRELKAQFQVRLNPYEEDEDSKILSTFDELIENEEKNNFLKNKNRNQILEEINEKIALLLKYDWERVKLESNKNILFPYGSIVFIFLNISMMLLLFIHKKLLNTDMLELFKKFIGESIMFNISIFISIFIFILGWILIAWRFIEFKSLIEDDKRSKLYEFLKMPLRRKYK